jgi:hypothetical protein
MYLEHQLAATDGKFRLEQQRKFLVHNRLGAFLFGSLDLPQLHVSEKTIQYHSMASSHVQHGCSTDNSPE